MTNHKLSQHQNLCVLECHFLFWDKAKFVMKGVRILITLNFVLQDSKSTLCKF